jgi:hypothetical protein
MALQLKLAKKKRRQFSYARPNFSPSLMASGRNGALALSRLMLGMLVGRRLAA